MSAIWGCVDLGGGALPEDLSGAMEKPLHEYKIDRYVSISDKNVVMGCGIQHITLESEYEPLPIYDAEEGIYFTADCIIDNRAELIGVLCAGRGDISDGELMFFAFKKWRDDMPKHVLGAYSYAVYETRKNRLIVGADHVFNRSIYFSRFGNRVYFSTVIESIIQGTCEKPKINEEWITLFLSITSLAVLSNPIDTPYKGISRVQASHYLVFEQNRDYSVEYWSPKNVKPLRLGSEDEYKEHFRNLMEQAAREVIRAPGEIGMFLSSGLDSSAVASFAEPILAKKGKRLYSYTHVPLATHKPTYNEKYVVANERKGVELVCGMYPGIVPKFMDFPEENAISSIMRILPTLEVPYKSHTNIAWLDAFTNIASNDGCKIMLTGQMGNTTISAGDIHPYVLSRIMHGRLIDAVSTINHFSKIHNIGRKRVSLYILNQLAPRFIKRKGIKNNWDCSFIDRDFARSIGISDNDSRTELNIGFMKPYTFEIERSMKFNYTAMAQVGEDETKLYLKHGMITRDITRDIRIFEFCLSAPMECFSGPLGQTRRLVRNYLTDKLPAALIDEKAPRGMQSSDVLDRLTSCWGDLYAELVCGCTRPLLQKYIDREMVATSLKKFEAQPEQCDKREFARLCAVYMIGIFLDMVESK